MNILELFQNAFIFLLNLLNSFHFFLLLVLIVFLYHLVLFISRDRNYIKSFNNEKDPENIGLGDLLSIPIVNIIIPAWKEGEIFRDCLNSISKLTYPRLKIIVNAGGDKETIKIASFFKKHNNFIILHQKGGANRPSLGKIKAVNECLDYVSEGLIYFIDADSYLNDEILLRIIFPLINSKEKIVGSGVRPLKSQENISLVKYLFFDRNSNFVFKFSRYSKRVVMAGQNTCVKFEVINSISKFLEDKKYATDKSMAEDMYSKGFKPYRLRDFRSRIFVDFSTKIREFIRQRVIWAENSLFYSYKYKKLKFLKHLLLLIFSLYILVSPFLILLNLGFLIIGVIFFLSIYLKKIRKYLFFKLTTGKEYPIDYNIVFFFKLIYYLLVEAVINIIIPFHLFLYYRSIKKDHE
ncbi:MAG: glycosyltransferase [Candidatus Thorarchaeota archaeon]